MKNNKDRRLCGKRGGALAKLLVFVVIFAGVLVSAWIFFLPSILTSTLEKRTGFDVEVASLRFNPFTANVDIKGLVLTNPLGAFPRKEFLEVRSFTANAKLKTLFSDRPQFEYALIDVGYVALVRNADGVLNATLFEERLAPVPPASADEAGRSSTAAKDRSSQRIRAKNAAKKEPARPKAPPVNFRINRLAVVVDRIVIVDHAQSTPSTREFNFRFSHVYEDFTDPKQLLEPFAVQSLAPVGSAISALLPGDLGKAMGAATRPMADDPQSEKTDPTDSLKTMVEKLEQTQKP